MKQFWEKMFNVESENGTWEIFNRKESKEVELQFWNYNNKNNEEQVNPESWILTYNQFNEFLDFANELRKKV